MLNEDLFDEVYFTNERNLEKHYNSHVLGKGKHADNKKHQMHDMTKNEYNELANKLSSSKAGPITSDDRVVGYIAKNGRYMKYDTETNLLVVYNDETAISLYKVKPKKFFQKTINDNHYGYFKELDGNDKLAETLNKISNYELLTKSDLDGLDKNYILEELSASNNIYWSITGEDCEILLENIKVIEEEK